MVRAEVPQGADDRDDTTIDRTVGVVDDGDGDGDGDDDDDDDGDDGDDGDGDGDGDGDAMLTATVMVILILILNRCILFTRQKSELGQVFDKKGMLPRESVQIRDSHTGAPGPGWFDAWG